MSALEPDELHAMAQSIDAGLHPRVRLELDLSVEAVDRLSDLLNSVAADLDHHAGIEATWPLHRVLGALAAAAPAPEA